MTLDEAIKHCEELVEAHDKLRKRYDDASGYSRSHNEAIRTQDAKKHEKCRQDFRQLAGWLKELKECKEQEPCADAISREAALMCMPGKYIVDLEYKPDDIISQHIKRIKALPSVTPKQKTGKWNVLGYDDPSVRMYKCSECHMKITLKFNYCPNCGAKMESEE
jgi:hypothetical protein